MFRRIGIWYTNLDRNLKNVEFSFKFYLGTFIIVLAIFGIFGILPISKNVITKYKLWMEMQQIHTTLQSNLVNLEKVESDLLWNSKAIAQLDAYMPVYTDIQSYLLQFVAAAASSGLEVKGFTQEPTSGDGRIDISTFLVGRSYPTDLIKKVEDLKRVTQVRDLSVSVGADGEITVNMSLSIYTVIE
jgi:Tfp pilus assembly protein PilO